jgi:hypothetical protein
MIGAVFLCLSRDLDLIDLYSHITYYKPKKGFFI